MSNALHTIISMIESHTGKPARKSGDGYRVLCPYHDGKNHNLLISDGKDRVLLHCFSQECDPKDILESVGLKIADVYHEQLTPEQSKNHKALLNDREIRAALETELIIILQWLSASNKALFPCAGDIKKEQVERAFRLTKNACVHYIEEGIK